MKIEAEFDENGDPIVCLKEIFNGVGLRTSEGHFLGICMRDDTFEINVMPVGEKRHHWFRVDMQNRTIRPL